MNIEKAISLSRAVDSLEGMALGGFDENEPRDANGRWTVGGAASKIANKIIGDYARNGYTTQHDDFRRYYSDLEDGEKLALVKELNKKGLVHPVLARKKKPPTGGELVDSMASQAKKHLTDHGVNPLNRHIPFTDSEAYKKATQ